MLDLVSKEKINMCTNFYMSFMNKRTECMPLTEINISCTDEPHWFEVIGFADNVYQTKIFWVEIVHYKVTLYECRLPSEIVNMMN